MKKSIHILLQLGFWLSYSILVLLILAAAPTESIDANRIIKIVIGFGYLPSALGFYGFYHLLFTKYLQKKKFFQFSLYSVLISIGSAIVAEAFLFSTLSKNLGNGTNALSLIQITLTISTIAFLSGVVALVIKGFLTWYSEIKLKQQLTEKNQKMELALVKAQLDPHFLFNTLNNIDVLIQKSPEKASNYLNKLSDIMRFMLFETKTDEISLDKELGYIKKYIELQKIRSSNSKFVELTINGKTAGISIAPMVLIPFIENAFKHVSNKQVDKAITIQLEVKANQIAFVCINNLANESHENKENFGLGNKLIQKRLHLLYPNKHTLSIKNESAYYQVKLTLQND